MEKDLEKIVEKIIRNSKSGTIPKSKIVLDAISEIRFAYNFIVKSLKEANDQNYNLFQEKLKLENEIIEQIKTEIGSIAKPDKIQFVPGLPKTRSGKIMRRILRKIAEGDTNNLGDTSTLLDPSLVDIIKEGKV